MNDVINVLFRSRNSLLLEGLRSIRSDLGHHKTFLSEVKSKVNNQGHLVQIESERIEKVTKEVYQREISGNVNTKGTGILNPQSFY